MTSPDFDQRLLDELASAAMDGTASESQLAELTALLRENHDARDHYLMLMDLHAVLSTELVASSSTIPSNSLTGEEFVSSSRRKWKPVAVAAALAACLLIAFNWFAKDDSADTSSAFAVIAQGNDAVWESDVVNVGQRIGPTTLQLKSGFVRLEFDSGVEVTLEGPVEYELIDAARTRLTSGMLTAIVPPGAEGFTVDTPSAQVIDLGTSFGIDVADHGISNVAVFDGEVEVSPLDADDKRLLTEGESVRIGTDYEVEDIAFDADPFEKMWPTASGVVGSSKSVHFLPPWPKQIRYLQSDDRIFLRAEGPSMRLQNALNVNISEPGDCSKVSDFTPAVIPSGESVRSYILHFFPATKQSPNRAKRVTASVTFEHPVLGIIVSRDELLASSRRFTRRGAGEGNQRRELEFTDDAEGDRISLSDDRKTLTLDLISPGRTSDLVRVVVERQFHRSRRRNRN